MIQLKRLALLVAATAGLGVLALWGAGAAANVPVLLDPSFGDAGGYTVLNITSGTSEDEPFELVRQPDGKFVAVGKSYHPGTSYDFTVMRWNADGTIDASFGNGGYATVDFFGGVDEALTVALQPDGKILVAGTVYNAMNSSSDMGLARFNSNGSLDTTFATYGAAGIASVDFTGGSDQALGMALLPDGKIVLAGYATIYGRPFDFGLVRYNADGNLDTTFGLFGRVATDIGGGKDIGTRVRLQPDGKLVVGGMSYNVAAGNFDYAVARYHANGQIDTSFSPAGKAGVETVDFSGMDDIGFALALRWDGKIIMGGLSRSPATDFDIGIAQFNANGTLDTGFATYGKPGVVTTDFSGLYDQTLYLAIQPDGKILAAGHTVSPTTGFDFALARYLPNGEIDTTFGSAGKVSTDLWGGPDGLHGVVLLPEGKAVVVGDGENPASGGDDVILASYLIADPTWIQGTLFTMPASHFSGSAARTALLVALNDVKLDIAANNYAAAVLKLQELRTRMDGCGASPDGSDWIVDCGQQLIVRSSVDQVIDKLD